MNPTQLRLLPDARPLVDRLGSGFFRSIPESPGVYLLRDAADAVLYVGKARNLRQRLGSYRVANPELLPRRRLRLLHLACRVEWQITADETSALARERHLLRELKPRFNRAGVWPAPSRHLAWRASREALELTLSSSDTPEWNLHGPLGAVASRVRAGCVRLLCCGWFGERGMDAFPAGWFQGGLPPIVRVEPGSQGPDPATVSAWLGQLLGGDPGPVRDWVQSRAAASGCRFLGTLVAAELDWFAGRKSPAATRPLTSGSGSM